MKQILKQILITLGLAVCGIQARAQCDLPQTPVCFSVTSGAAINAYWAVTEYFAPDSPSYAIRPGVEYRGWCLAFDKPIDTAFSYCNAINYYSDGALPPHLVSPKWGYINYIINAFPNAAASDVQSAIWSILNGIDPFTAAAASILNAALANGVSFVPGPGQKRAVIVDLGPEAFFVQPIILEVTCGTPPPPPPPECVGTGTIGYWKNHSVAWPVVTITIGGAPYTKAQAIEVMKRATRGDKTLSMFEQLVAAKLNVLAGNSSGCISSTIAAADAWLALYPLGSNVAASSAAWGVGGPWATKLDEYNNGRLCAPHRDTLDCNKRVSNR